MKGELGRNWGTVLDVSGKVAQDGQADVDEEVCAAASDAVDAYRRHCWRIVSMQRLRVCWEWKDVRKMVRITRRIMDTTSIVVAFADLR